jgi:hypothetical protein
LPKGPFIELIKWSVPKLIVSYTDLLLNDEDEPYEEFEQNSVTPKNISYNNPLTHVGVWN